MAERTERITRKYIHFTKRDKEIVQAVFYARYLNTEQIAALFFNGKRSSSCRKRLRYLYDEKYLDKRTVESVSDQDVYFVGLRGRHFLKGVVPFSGLEIDKIAGVTGNGNDFLKHDLTLSWLYVNAILGCREHNWSLEWKNARMLEMEKLSVQPDAYLKTEKEAFIEFTDVLPSEREMRSKLNGYRTLLEAKGGVLVLWFTTSKRNFGFLSKHVKGFLYHDWILLGFIEDKGNFLTKPMWKWTEKEELIRFLKPHEIIVYGGGSAVTQPHPD